MAKLIHLFANPWARGLVGLALSGALLVSGCGRESGEPPARGADAKPQVPVVQEQPSGGGPTVAKDSPMLDQLAVFERQDMGVQPTNRLHGGPMHAPTPNEIPGGQVITTKGLLQLVRGTAGVAPIVFDVLGGPQTLPNAVPAVTAAQPGDYTDQMQQQFGKMLQQVTRGNPQIPLVFYCEGPMCWMSYNAALRAIKLGYRNVLWYRGGLEAWRRAAQPLVAARQFGGPPQQGTNPPQGDYAQQRGTPQRGGMDFTTYEVTDPNFGGMRVSTLSIPVGWRAKSEVRWDFTSANYPVRVLVHVQSPDGKMWIEILPMDAVYWMDRTFGRPPPLGQRSYGAVYAPNAGIEQAMQTLVVQPARGKMPGFQVISKHPVDPARLARAFNKVNWRGEAMSMRVQYRLNGAPAEEDFYTFYTAVQAIPYTGPQGTTHEYHRMLLLSHAVGATDGLLASVYPLLGTVAASIRVDEQFQWHIQAVQQHITAQYNAALKRGYDSIAAAGQLSRTISANNDALLSSMQQRRAAQNQADAARRAAAARETSSNDAFSQYIHGTTRMEDPYWGTSERDSNYSYHWTDGQGNYRASNDSGFNPNIGSGGGPNWQRMSPAR